MFVEHPLALPGSANNDEGVCRTAPATPGLLNTLEPLQQLLLFVGNSAEPQAEVTTASRHTTYKNYQGLDIDRN